MNKSKMNIMEELNNLSKYQKDIDTLISRGDCLMLGLLNELQDQLGDSYKKLPQKEKERISQYSFNDKYNEWYNESLTIIKQLIPARLDDFIEYYKSSKRKGLLTYETYTISDYLINLCRKPTFSALGVSKTSVFN